MSTVIEDQTGSLTVRFEHLRTTEDWQLTEEQAQAGLVDAIRMKTIAEAQAARLVALAENFNTPSLQGCISTGVWLSNLTGISRAEAKRILDPARELNDLVEDTYKTWSAGNITIAQATIICKAVNELPDFVGYEERLVAQNELLTYAKEFSNHDLQRLANRILEVVDPDGVDEHQGKKLDAEEKKAWAKTSLKMFKTGNGLTKGIFLLPDVQAGILRGALEGIASPRRNSPAICEHSDAANGPLTHDMKLGRALWELLEHLPSKAMPQHGGLAATITVNIDYDKLKDQIGTATLSTGDEMSAAQARRCACNAGLLPIVLDGKSHILDHGMAKRLYGKGQRIGMAHRDKGCVSKGCDRPASWTEAHHIKMWSEGGPTNASCGALFCFYHHHLLHEGEWWARMAPDGVPEVIPPKRVDPRQKPLRHARFAAGP